jgi:hypothetical protein
MTTCTTMLLPPTHAVQPIEWWADADLDAVRVLAEDACSAWVRDWIGGAPKVEIRAVRAHERPPANRQAWVALGTRGERAAWVEARSDDVEGVLHTLFPTESGHIASVSVQGIAYTVAAKAHCALIEALRARLGLDAPGCEAEPDAALFKPWSGSMLISVALSGGRAIAVLLNCATARSVFARDGLPKKEPCEPQPARAALDPLTQALAGRRLLLRVGLSSCELDIGTLESLRIGDIVPLPHSLDTPLAVSTVQGVHVCAGFLGCQDGVKAIELAREVSIDHDTPFSQPTQRHV